jgi:RluA family pseudouridine synthase
MTRVTNIAAYLFASLSDLKPLRARLLAFCSDRALRGTILLSTEGINLFVAGGAQEIGELLGELHAIPGLAGLTPKYSYSSQQPFSRMLVRIKREIIAFGIPGIDPAQRTSPKLPAAELKRWLDEGRPLVLLDTRNDYEVQLGTFRGAVPAGIRHFRDFPKAVAALPEAMKDQPVVMFCTGGIRCEKAGPYMEREGFREIYQLDGGILKYFEECGRAHYDGECFVFDHRVGLDPMLEETDSTVCYACQAPLRAGDTGSPRYVPGISCPQCWLPPEGRAEQRRLRLQEKIDKVAEPLPGSVPADNFRPMNVPGSCDGTTVTDFLACILPHIPAGEWEPVAAAGRLLGPEGTALKLHDMVRTGQRLVHLIPAEIEPPVDAAVRVLHVDEALVVVHKPAPLPVHPGGRFHRNTLIHLLNLAVHPDKVRPAHRLDASTTGVMVLTRARRWAGLLQPQFASGEVEKRYLARVHGHPAADRFRSEASLHAIPQETGRIDPDDEGETVTACTDFLVVARWDDGTSLVEAMPRTGRTNQIRAHLWQLGHPIVGDPFYLRAGKVGATVTAELGDPPLCLHSAMIAFRHPVSGAEVRFTAEPPAWALGPDRN